MIRLFRRPAWLLAPVAVMIAFGLAPGIRQAAGEPVGRVERESAADLVSGLWHGIYLYPEGSGQESVKFQVIVHSDGKTVVGFMKEPNTFGAQGEPWLHASCKGRFEEKENRVTFTKTYDGSAGVSHDVEYGGTLTRDRTKIEGSWAIGDFSGRFVLERQRLDDRALEVLK